MLNKICTRTAKSAPYPPFPASDALYPDSGCESPAGMRRITQPPHIAEPLVKMRLAYWPRSAS